MKLATPLAIAMLLFASMVCAEDFDEGGEESGADPTAMTIEELRKKANSKDHSQAKFAREYPGSPSLDTFEMQALEKPAQAPEQATNQLKAPHDLMLTLDKNGAAWISMGASSLAQESLYGSGFFIRDAKTDGPVTPVKLAPKNTEALVQEGEVPGLQLRLQARYEVSGEGIQVSGEIEDLTKSDRAISIYYAVPVRNESLVWWEDVRTSHPVTKPADYLTTKALDAGATAAHSFYPMCALNNSDMGLSLAIPIDRPSLYRLGYSPSTQLAYVAFDFALTQETKKFPGKAQFSFNIMAIDPAWGFRSALERYYATFPQFFTKHAKHEGIWTYNDQTKLQRPQDFGVMYHETNGTPEHIQKQIDLDDELGIYSILYTSPEPYNVDFKEKDKREYDVLMKRWEEQKTRTDLKGERARIHEATGIKNEDGTYWHQFVNRSWVSGARMAQNPDPELPKDKEGLNRAVVNYPASIAKMFTNCELGELGKGLDGIYLDSIGLFTNRPNFRKDHFATSDFPLTFDTKTKTPCLIEEWSVAEFCKWLAEDLHDRGKLVMGNYYPKTFPFLMPYIDLPGTEGTWRSTDLEMNYWRAMSYQKPYLILAHPDSITLTAKKIESDFRYPLFYGMYPSYFQGTHKEGDKKIETFFFDNPEYYNKGREVFGKYIPIIRQLSLAGWEPVTGARSNDPLVWVERYGRPEKGSVFITVMNASKQEKPVTLQLEKTLAIGEKMNVKNLLSNNAIKMDGQTVAFTLAGNDVAALELKAQ